MKKLLEYIKHSVINVTIAVNPRQWDLYYKLKFGRGQMDPGRKMMLSVDIIFLKLYILIDDGSW